MILASLYLTCLMFPADHYFTVKSVFKGHLCSSDNVSLHDLCPFVTGSFYLPRRRRPGTGDIATPPVCPSVCLSVCPSVRPSCLVFAL